MTRYLRTLFYNRRACEALAKERVAGKEEPDAIGSLDRVLFEHRLQDDGDERDADRYQLSYLREPKGD
jgi:hypothetical protein